MSSHTDTAKRSEQTATRAFWWRLVDNVFRHPVMFLLPILLFGMLGLTQAGKTQVLYQANGVLSASSNPLLPVQSGASDGIQQWESPADGVSRLINERLRTDQFIVNVAELAGLTNFVETDPAATAIIRESVWASSGGNSLLSVSSTWSDPQTTYELVTATIEAFQQYLADSVASNSSEAKAFYSELLLNYQKQATDAENTLIDYRDALPELEPDESYPLADQLELQRLSKALENADESVAGVQAELEEAALAVSQSRSQAGRSLTLIDAPKVPTAPVSTLIKRVTTAATFTILGILIALGAVLLTTVTDRSVISSADVLGFEGVSMVATVPRLTFAHTGDSGSRPWLRRFRWAREKVSN